MLPNPNPPAQRVHVPVGDKVDVVFENPNIKFSDLLIEGHMAPLRYHGRHHHAPRFHLSIKVKKNS